MNRIISKSAREISKILFNLELYNFLAYLECVRSYAWSKGHSDPDLSSVNLVVKSQYLHIVSIRIFNLDTYVDFKSKNKELELQT